MSGTPQTIDKFDFSKMVRFLSNARALEVHHKRQNH